MATPDAAMRARFVRRAPPAPVKEAREDPGRDWQQTLCFAGLFASAMLFLFFAAKCNAKLIVIMTVPQIRAWFINRNLPMRVRLRGTLLHFVAVLVTYPLSIGRGDFFGDFFGFLFAYVYYTEKLSSYTPPPRPKNTDH